MFFQIFAIYCKAAGSALQLQQEMLCRWADLWSQAMATAAGMTEPIRAPRGQGSGNGTAATHRAAPSPVGNRLIDEASRITGVPMIRRPYGDADGFAPAPRHATTVLSPAPATEVRDGARIQLHEEQLEVRKQVMQGEVRVRKEVVTEYRTLEVPVQREEIIIERHAPTGAPVAASALRPGEELRIAVREEQVRVEKRPVVTEEVTVGKRVVRETERLGGEVRKEQLRVEREGDVDVHEHAPEAGSRSSS